ncbi:hypothetical protein Riv7116_4143 [Rivularia sp. PCC 7116]|nr:hypothetical protein Riv7116_4143 [Rivularia sp. PCC 7116]
MKSIKRTTLNDSANPQNIYEVNLWEMEEEKYEVTGINQVAI